ncbi:MAG TPA: phosphoribosylanthranilate isomerase [Gemmatimonadota bacterium]|nr:phosphoribosylanthranilate isomerase [Gemmatimonadota bacterium]
MSASIRIKVCGLTEPAGARAAREAGADFLGIVFAPGSPRRLDPARAAALVARVPAAWVGVFVDPVPSDVARIAGALELAAVQLHGDESPDRCREIRAAAGVPVWKALGPGAGPLEDWAEAVDAVLLDSGAGGGRPLPWRDLAARLERRRPAVPLFLAGGLEASNVAEAIAVLAPDGVDASSRLERSPGLKDPARVRAFVAAARAAWAPAAR